MSTVRPPTPRPMPRPRNHPGPAFLLAVLLMLAAPLMSGCLERSTTVGDRFAGSVIVATSPDNPRGAPQFDIPESMRRDIAITDYRETPSTSASAQPGGGTTEGDDTATRVGSRATFSNLTAGQLSQLGDIVADSFGDTPMTMELSAKRSGDVVRFRGTADLTGLVANRDYVKLTMSFAGPVTATNGDQSSDTSVSWTPEPGKPSDFTAEATYADPATAAFGGWTILMVLICLAVVLVVARLAYVSRDRSPRPGRPAETAKTSKAGKRSTNKNTSADPASPGPSGPRGDEPARDAAAVGSTPTAGRHEVPRSENT
ncbi:MULTISPECIES: LppM family (lipo)protein [unclassified Gordonia (in: high G+C Gram-positive bacteria)]